MESVEAIEWKRTDRRTQPIALTIAVCTRSKGSVNRVHDAVEISSLFAGSGVAGEKKTGKLTPRGRTSRS